MCGVIVVCMCAVLCDYWNLWLTCGGKMETVRVQLLSKPSMNSRQLRLIVMSWIVNDNFTTCNHVLTTEIIKGSSNTSNDQEKIDTKSTTNSQIAQPHNTVNNLLVCILVDSDDDFMPTSVKRTRKNPSTTSKGNDFNDELIKSEKVGRPLILGILPEGYTYKMITITNFKDLDSFDCELKIKLETEKVDNGLQ